MPRRSPPTPLRLHQGPLPLRGKPKHTMPSLPRPAFHRPIPIAQGPASRPRARSIAEQDEPTLNLQSSPSSPASEHFVRGPWDHSASIKVSIDISAVLPPPKQAAVFT
ncbi:uncharacterized protein PHACADRAFT_96073 [Phanerochaete carnosa HHB-10118-sp]|uniref:Uncharacterized protein n=1 Tax=Phanerochaete carnosa (strain HHB-10118-sp) TaxID=650164 RepID=K5VW25_PHACS|nr:uncharacterized protein PHACADRAFT_96073 [Phanerochaete carnosa HHB-10118-sp]EKM55753.1 hypothetical protein PHACADRAFT_96073 [Phanerochaete carnosa HHB-10118-sp]